jgi:hypothetical protein
MDNELFYRMNRKLMKIWLPMAFATAILVVVAGSIYKYTEIDFKNNATKAFAEINGVTEYGYPILSYVVDGKEYKIKSRYLIPNPKVGSKVEIEYHKENPTFIQIGENPIYQSSIWMIGFGTFGAVATAYLLYKRRTSTY